MLIVDYNNCSVLHRVLGFPTATVTCDYSLAFFARILAFPVTALPPTPSLYNIQSNHCWPIYLIGFMDTTQLYSISCYQLFVIIACVGTQGYTVSF